MGIRISSLSANALPYTGREQIPLVQNATTRAGTLSSFVNYLSGDFAFVNRPNTFIGSQTIQGNLSVQSALSATTIEAVSARFSSRLTARDTVLFDVESSAPTLQITQRGSGNALVVEDSSLDASPFVVTANGTLLIGDTTSKTIPNVTTSRVQINSESEIGNSAGISCIAWDSDAIDILSSPVFSMSRSLAGSVGTQTAVVQNTSLGVISYNGSDGTQFIRAAQITGGADGNATTNSMPGRLVFSTTPAGASIPVEHMRITSSGNIGVGTSTPNQKLTVFGNLSVSGSLSATMIEAISSRVTFLDIREYELSGFRATGPVIIETNSSDTTLRITQSGTGDVIRVEDETNPDTSPFIIKSDGKVGIGTTNPNSTLTVIGNISSTGSFSDLNGSSSNWNNTYTAVSPNSANWNTVYSTVCSQSANWSGSIVLDNSNTTVLLALSDAYDYMRLTSPNPITIQIPALAWAIGTPITFRRTTAAGAITLSAGVGVNINDDDAANIQAGDTFILKFIGSNNWDFI